MKKPRRSVAAAPPEPSVLQVEIERCREVFRCELTDPDWLFAGYGLTSEDEDEFVEMYRALPFLERPPISPFFDTGFYLNSNPDVAHAGVDPYFHFIEWGLSEQRAPHPLI